MDFFRGSSNPTYSGKVDRKALAKLIGTGYTEEAMGPPAVWADLSVALYR